MLSFSFVTAREAMAMVELGADHLTLGQPVLTDLAEHDRLPSHQKGMYKTAIHEQVGSDPHFMWENWSAPVPESARTRMEEIAKSDPLRSKMTKDSKMASTEVDYLQRNVLDECNREDEVTKVGVMAALESFSVSEEDSRKFIEGLQATLA